jgi:hypothetical protein
MPYGFMHNRNKRVEVAKRLQTRRRFWFDQQLEKYETERKPYME